MDGKNLLNTATHEFDTKNSTLKFKVNYYSDVQDKEKIRIEINKKLEKILKNAGKWLSFVVWWFHHTKRVRFSFEI